MMSFDDFIGLLKKWMPQTYWGPLESKSGWELFQAIAKVGERLSKTIDRIQNALFPSTASGQITPYIYFMVSVDTATGQKVLGKGTIVERDDGARYRTTEDLTIDDGETSSTVKAVPVAVSLQSDIFTGTPGYSYLVRDFGDGTTTGVVWQIDGIDENQTQQEIANPGTLDLLAAQRNITRMPGESDDSLRTRIRTFAQDRISPSAVTKCLDYAGLTGNMVTSPTVQARFYFELTGNSYNYTTQTMGFTGFAYVNQSYVNNWFNIEREAKYAALEQCVESRRAAGVYWYWEDSTGARTPKAFGGE